MIRVFVFTSDKYMQALQPFAFLFNRYWSDRQPVIVSGFSPPHFDLPDNFTFFSLGSQENYPFGKWSDAVIDTLLHFPKDDIFCLMLEDYWLIRHVRQDIIGIAEGYMRQYRNVLKFDLCAERRYAAGSVEHGVVGDITIVRSDPNSAYHFSLLTGLWNRDLLLSVLLRDWSPHEVELAGTPHLAHRPELLVLGTITDPWPLRHTLAFRGGNSDKLLLDEIVEADLADLRLQGFIP